MTIKVGDTVYPKSERGTVRNAFKQAYYMLRGRRSADRRFGQGDNAISVKDTAFEVLEISGDTVKMRAKSGQLCGGTEVSVPLSAVERRARGW